MNIVLENGADNEREATENVDALYAAASSGHSEVVKLLYIGAQIQTQRVESTAVRWG